MIVSPGKNNNAPRLGLEVDEVSVRCAFRALSGAGGVGRQRSTLATLEPSALRPHLASGFRAALLQTIKNRLRHVLLDA